MERFHRAGLTFGVTETGAVGADAVVLLHGFPQDRNTFDGVVADLTAHGLRTLVPTQRGYSAAARPSQRRDYRTQETAADLIALLDAAGLRRAHLVGHDWGAVPAWATAAWHPSRVASLTVLSTPHPRALAASFVTSLQGIRSSYMVLFNVPALPEVVAARTLRRTLADSGLPTVEVERYCAAMSAPGALTGALNWYRGMPFSFQPRVGKVEVPTTYVWGRHDFALGRAAAERTSAWVAAPYRFVELDAGHWLPETRPDAVAAAIIDRVMASSP